MEPTDNHSQMSEDDHLAALMRTSSPDLADDGFSVRVLSALPAQKEARVFYARMIVSGTAGLAGLIVAWQRDLSAETLNLAAEQLSESLLEAATSLDDYRLLAALAATCLSLIYAFRAQLRDNFRI